MIGRGISPFLSSYYGGSAPPASNNPTVQAYLDKATLEGYTLPTAPKIAIYNAAWDYADAQALTPEFDLVGLLKVENENLCKIPFIHSGGAAKRFTLVDGPIFTANVGLKSDGDGYLDTDWIENVNAINWQLGDGSYGAYTTAVLLRDESPIGALSLNGANNILYPGLSSGDAGAYIQNKLIIATVTDVTGLSSASVNGNNVAFNRNGVQLATGSDATPATLGNSKWRFLDSFQNNAYFTDNAQFFFVSSGSIDQAKLNTFVTMLLL